MPSMDAAPRDSTLDPQSHRNAVVAQSEHGVSQSVGYVATEVLLLVTLFFVYAGDPPPMVNEAHYLVKAKSFWDPTWCANDVFVSSGKAHTTFYATFGWLTMWLSLPATAWVGRWVGWTLVAIGLQRLSSRLFTVRYVSLALASIWLAGIEFGNLAGEWVVGGIEAKVPAYGFMLMGLASLVGRQWNATWIFFGLASAFHVLTGGWSVIAATIAWWLWERPRSDRRAFICPGLFVGGTIALLGLWPAFQLTLNTSPADAAMAARIYTYYRLPHHLLPAEFELVWYVRHGVILLATCVLARFVCHRCQQDHQFNSVDRDAVGGLMRFTIGALCIAAIGLALGMLPSVSPDLAAKLLRYYWFRLSDAVVPLMFAVLVTSIVLGRKSLWRRTGIVLTGLAVLLIAYSAYQRATLAIPPAAINQVTGTANRVSRQQQRQVFLDWLAVCRWARLSTGADEVFLTPRHQQTFKWYAERAEVVNWKDVPQDAISLKAWYERFNEVFPRRLGHVRVTIRYDVLRGFRNRYGVRYLIVDRRVSGDNLPLPKIYPTPADRNQTYAVYELPR